MLYSSENLQQSRLYTPEEISAAALIIHPKILDRYGLVKNQVAHILEIWSNLTPLKNPLIDQFWNEYWDSEGLYMAERTDNLWLKKLLAFASTGRLSKTMSERHYNELEQDPIKRIECMRFALRQKFEKNTDLLRLLLETLDLQIIEYTYWGDDFFGIKSQTNIGSNILWKLLMELRDSYLCPNALNS